MKIAYVQPPNEELMAYALEDALKALRDAHSIACEARDKRRSDLLLDAITAVRAAAEDK